MDTGESVSCTMQCIKQTNEEANSIFGALFGRAKGAEMTIKSTNTGPPKLDVHVSNLSFNEQQ